MEYLITETCDYIVEANSKEEALDIFINADYGPEILTGGPVNFHSVVERTIEVDNDPFRF